MVSRGRISIVTVNRELYRIADIGMQLFVARCNTPGTLNHTGDAQPHKDVTQMRMSREERFEKELSAA